MGASRLCRCPSRRDGMSVYVSVCRSSTHSTHFALLAFLAFLRDEDVCGTELAWVGCCTFVCRVSFLLPFPFSTSLRPVFPGYSTIFLAFKVWWGGFKWIFFSSYFHRLLFPSLHKCALPMPVLMQNFLQCIINLRSCGVVAVSLQSYSHYRDVEPY